MASLSAALVVSYLLFLSSSVLTAPVTNIHPENARKLSRDSVNVVSYTFTLQEWVVDYMRPTVDLGGAAARQTPFNVPDSQRKNAYLVNGQYPGPEIVVFEGDIIEVVVQNQLLSESVSIHWHGIHMTDAPYMDGARGITQSPILPGNNFTYRFNAYPAGTHYWHAHMDAVQSARGIKGPLVVQKREDPFQDLYDEELIVSISDEWQDPSVCLKLEGAMPGNDVCADIRIAGFNGQYGNGSATYPFPLLHVNQGTCYRLRFIMMGSNAENFVTSIAGHTMTLLSVDGSDVHPLNVSSFNIHLGERYDILLCANQDVGNYLVNMTYDYACALTPGHFIPPGFSPVPACSFYGYVSYNGSGIPNDLNGTGGGVNPKPNSDVVFDLTDYASYWLTSPLNPIQEPEEPDIRYVINMGLKGPTYSGPQTPPLSEGLWYMDVQPQTRPFSMPTSPLYVTKGQCGVQDIPIFNIPESAKVVELVINNLSPTAHIIHLHGLPFTVINYADFPWCDLSHTNCFTMTYLLNPCPRKDVQVGDPEYPNLVKGMYWGCSYDPKTDPVTQNLTAPLIKDTMQVWQRSWAVIRFRATNPGYWMFHCHMEQHIPLGMQMVFNVLPSQQPAPPPDLPGYADSCIFNDMNSVRMKNMELKMEVEELRHENELLRDWLSLSMKKHK